MCVCVLQGDIHGLQKQPLRVTVAPNFCLYPKSTLITSSLLERAGCLACSTLHTFTDCCISLGEESRSRKLKTCLLNKSGSQTPGAWFHRAACMAGAHGPSPGCIVYTPGRVFSFNGAPKPPGITSSQPQPPPPPDARLLNYNSLRARLLIKPN